MRARVEKVYVLVWNKSLTNCGAFRICSSFSPQDWSGRAPVTLVEELALEIVAHNSSKNHVAEQQLLLPSAVYVVQF